MEKEELTELVNALADMCLTSQAVMTAQQAKIDALIACTVQHRPHEAASLRDLLLQGLEHGQSSVEPEKRRVFQGHMAQTLEMIDRLAGG